MTTTMDILVLYDDTASSPLNNHDAQCPGNNNNAAPSLLVAAHTTTTEAPPRQTRTIGAFVLYEYTLRGGDGAAVTVDPTILYGAISHVYSLHHPLAIFTVGIGGVIRTTFAQARDNPLHALQGMWHPVDGLDGITPAVLRNAAMYGSLYGIERVLDPSTIVVQKRPLITAFTSTYNSGDKLYRPYRCLLNQTYTHWEWVVVDDSPVSDGNATWSLLCKLRDTDPRRIRIYRADGNNGYIGDVKRTACDLGRGDWLCELDHDDRIAPTLFQYIVAAEARFPGTGFVCSDCCELYEPDDRPFEGYGEKFAMGYGAYYKTFDDGKWQNVNVVVPLNGATLSHIVGVPNHIRAWKRCVYEAAGKHNPRLAVADDFDLFLRTCLTGCTMVRIADLQYLQYRNVAGNNFTFLRNALIQDLVSLIAEYHRPAIRLWLARAMIRAPEGVFTPASYENFVNGTNERVQGGIVEYTRFEQDGPRHFLMKCFNPSEVDDTAPLVCIVMPTYKRTGSLLHRAIESVLDQTYTNWQLYIVGDACPDLEGYMTGEFLRGRGRGDKRVRWWNLDRNHGAGGAVPRNYALKMLCSGDLVAYLDDDNRWTPTHLTTLVTAIGARDAPDTQQRVQYAFSSMMVEGKPIVCTAPVFGRLDTSAMLHRYALIEKYGPWRDRLDGGYCHDWELFSRWKDEPYTATGQATLLYNTDTNHQSYASIAGLVVSVAQEEGVKAITDSVPVSGTRKRKATDDARDADDDGAALKRVPCPGCANSGMVLVRI
jgi:glycosyltransferase involved in cell wall biosynthesis